MKITHRTIKLLSLATIVAHLGISIIHGLAHQGAMVALTTFGSVYVLVGVLTLYYRHYPFRKSSLSSPKGVAPANALNEPCS